MRITRLVLVLGMVALVAAVSCIVGVAVAKAPTYAIVAGTMTTGTANFTARTSPVEFRTSRGLNLGCTSARAAGTVRLSTKSNGAKVATVTATSSTGCRGPLGYSPTVTQIGRSLVNISSGPTAGVTPTTVTRVAAKVADSGGQCSFEMRGDVRATFDQNTQRFSVMRETGLPYPLMISNVEGCFGQIVNGDTATVAAIYDVSNDAGPFAVVSN